MNRDERHVVTQVVAELRQQAGAERWGSQDAVVTWLRNLATKLEKVTLMHHSTTEEEP